ncbi:hypothetical protein PPL_04650 [Heterostelium album PN500]|uniref:Uncharacterized protein n=1 Tax=Heterostelium pallidum (strain ATCC 26659 / Pp 5 / PN500) TaxID=670386 RepID=D3B859_HETP5|nr:hypothetical protein PPL_04650 [Heterostelium album PN500]EFA82227.1 hypothetical protein PPL_04650 [Heterostelium album PN500]|eukprot:XP_020434344.1 hypothetical protein PPL_04650 [Heterostelium album PN500]
MNRLLSFKSIYRNNNNNNNVYTFAFKRYFLSSSSDFDSITRFSNENNNKSNRNNNNDHNIVKSKELSKEFKGKFNNKRKSKQHVQALYHLVKAPDQNIQWKSNIVEFIDSLRSLNQIDELAANVNHVNWKSVQPEVREVVANKLREVLEKLLDLESSSSSFPSKTGRVFRSGPHHLHQHQQQQQRNIQHLSSNEENINAIATSLVSLYLVGGFKEEAEEIVRLSPSLDIYVLMLLERLRTSGPAAALRYYTTTPPLSNFEKSPKFAEFMHDLKSNHWTLNTYYLGLQQFLSNTYSQLIHSQSFDKILSHYSSDQLSAFIVLVELFKQQVVSQKQQDEKQQQQQIQHYNDLINNIEISIDTQLQPSVVSNVLSSVVLHFLHLDRYELALKWFARRVRYSLTPDSDSIFHFIHYHESRKSNTDRKLLAYWDSMRFDYGFLKKLDSQARLDYNRRFIYYLQQGVKMTKQTSSSSSSIQQQELSLPREPTDSELELDKELASSGTNNNNNDNDKSSSSNNNNNNNNNNIRFDNICRVVYNCIKQSPDNIPSGTRLLEALCLLRELRPSYFLHFQSGLPKSIRPLAFHSNDYSKLKTYLSETIKYLDNNDPLMYSGNTMILNYLVVGIAQCKQFDLLLSLLTKMVSQNTLLFDWAIESSFSALIANNLYPEQLVSQMEPIYMQGGAFTSIQNCKLNSYINKLEQQMIHISNDDDNNNNNLNTSIESIIKYTSKIHQPNLLTHSIVLKLSQLILQQSQQQEQQSNNTEKMMQHLFKYLPSGTFQMRHISIIECLLDIADRDEKKRDDIRVMLKSHIDRYYESYLEKENLDLLLVFALSKAIEDPHKMVAIFKVLPVAKGYQRELIETIKRHNQTVQDAALHKRLSQKDIFYFSHNPKTTLTEEASSFINHKILNK